MLVLNIIWFNKKIFLIKKLSKHNYINILSCKIKCFDLYLALNLSSTTRFHNFTDENIPSVCDRTFVGKVFTDYITDGIHPSEYLLSVMPHSTFLAPSAKVSVIFYTDRIFPSVKSSVNLYRRIISVGDGGRHCPMPTELFRR